jgi:hypothetical protein
MFPQDSGYAAIAVLKREGREELGAIRQRVARDQVLRGPRGPDCDAAAA